MISCPVEPLHLLGSAVLDYKEAAAAACGIHESCRAFRTGPCLNADCCVSAD